MHGADNGHILMCALILGKRITIAIPMIIFRSSDEICCGYTLRHLRFRSPDIQNPVLPAQIFNALVGNPRRGSELRP